jgi:tetratricopeptide (TPR) repeat protein
MSETSRRKRTGERVHPPPTAGPAPAPAGAGGRFPAVALALVLAVAAIYGPTAHHQFVAYDDDVYVFANPAVRGGLSWQGFLWSFGYHAGNWHPLTWLSHMLDARLFGAWAGGHHLVSAGLHAANAVLLLALLARLTGAFWRSAAVAGIFALHPLRVESVAWAAERKDVLSALFWLLTLLAYARFVRRPGAGRYLAALALFALGLTAKPMLVTLPFVLLLLDWWPLGRVPPPGASRATAARRGWAALAGEKAPFFALALASSLVTLRGQTHGATPMVSTDAPTRFGNAALSCLRYLGSFLWPHDLAPLYPYPRAGIPPALAAGAAALVALATAAAFLLARRRPSFTAGWLWYLGTLVPVMGLVQVGAQSRSDRYTYLPLLGVTIALVWAAGDLGRRRPAIRPALALSCGAALAALGIASAHAVPVWRNSLTLFAHTVRVTADNDIMLNNLGAALQDAGRDAEAVQALAEAVRVNPAPCDPHYNLGRALYGSGRYDEALAALTRALGCYEARRASPDYVADAHYKLGMTFLQLGRHGEAEREFTALLRIIPDYVGGREGLAASRLRQRGASPVP